MGGGETTAQRGEAAAMADGDTIMEDDPPGNKWGGDRSAG